MKITGLRTERVEIEISKETFISKLWELSELFKPDYTIEENESGKLVYIEEHGFGNHSYETEIRKLTEQEVELYNAINVIEKYIIK